MKRIISSAVLLMLCLAFSAPMMALRHGVPRYLDKETTPDMSKMNNICVGWVDLGADDWGAHGYTTKTDWTNIIESLNASFISNLKATYLPGKTIIAAKGPEDNKPTGCDVIIRFSDVHIDYNEYHLILSIHFFDPKTNTEIGTIPVRPYYGNDWGLRGYLNETLKEIGVKTSSLDALIQSTYQVLGLRTFFTFNEKEVRAWTIHAGATAVKAAGAIHTDFERGFIKAETVNCQDLIQCGSIGRARETGHYRIEGRDYVVRDGDVLLFRFSI